MSAGTPTTPEREPFGPVATPSAYVPSAACERALASLEWSVRDGSGVAALLGPPGLGKTLLLRLLSERCAGLRCVYVPFCSLDLAGLCALALDALGEPRGDDPVATLAARANALAGAGSGLLLLVDDAGAIPEATALHLATLVDSLRGALRLVLASVDDASLRRVLNAFGEVELVRLVEGLSLEEARRLVARQLEWAAAPATWQSLFTDEVVEELHRLSDGVPRRLNLSAQAFLRSLEGDARQRLGPVLARAAARARVGAPLPPLTLASLSPAAPHAGEYRVVRGRAVDPRTGRPVAPRQAEAEPALPAEPAPAVVGAAPEPEEPPSAVAAEPAEAPGAEPAAPRRAAVSETARPQASRLLQRLRGALVLVAVAAVSLWVGVWYGRSLEARHPRILPAVPGGASPDSAAHPEAAASTPAAPSPTATVPAPSAPPRPVAPRAAPAPLARRVAPKRTPPPTAHATPAEPARSPAAPTAAKAEAAPAASPVEPSTAPAPAAPAPAALEASVPETTPPAAAAPRAGEAARATPAAPEPTTSGAAEPAPAEAPAQPRIAVGINAVPWATIEVDGVELGETPLADVELTPGPHTFRAHMPDGSVRERVVEIGPDRRTVVFE